MVTKLSDTRGQVAIKGRGITDDWERLVKAAAKQNGQGIGDWIADVTTIAAQSTLKNEPAIPAALPVKLEDIASGLLDRLDRLERQGRRGRWRR